MQKALIAILVSASLVIPNVSAAFSLGDLGSILGTDKKQGESLSAQQDKILKNYIDANVNVLTANALMADSLGLETEAETARAMVATLSEGATKGALEEANKEVSASTTAVMEALKQTPKLDAAAKVSYSKGLLQLGIGVVKLVAVGKQIKDFSGNVSSASLLELPKLQPSIYLVSSFPSTLSTTTSALSNAVSFAKGAGIPVPKDVSSVLSVL